MPKSQFWLVCQHVAGHVQTGCPRCLLGTDSPAAALRGPLKSCSPWATAFLPSLGLWSRQHCGGSPLLLAMLGLWGWGSTEKGLTSWGWPWSCLVSISASSPRGTVPVQVRWKQLFFHWRKVSQEGSLSSAGLLTFCEAPLLGPPPAYLLKVPTCGYSGLGSGKVEDQPPSSSKTTKSLGPPELEDESGLHMRCLPPL